MKLYWVKYRMTAGHEDKGTISANEIERCVVGSLESETKKSQNQAMAEGQGTANKSSAANQLRGRTYSEQSGMLSPGGSMEQSRSPLQMKSSAGLGGANPVVAAANEVEQSANAVGDAQEAVADNTTRVVTNSTASAGTIRRALENEGTVNAPKEKQKTYRNDAAMERVANACSTPAELDAKTTLNEKTHKVPLQKSSTLGRILGFAGIEYGKTVFADMTIVLRWRVEKSTQEILWASMEMTHLYADPDNVDLNTQLGELELEGTSVRGQLYIHAQIKGGQQQNSGVISYTMKSDGNLGIITPNG